MKKDSMKLILAGLLIGIGAIALMLAGNPGNMGLCIACFLRDTAGAIKLHSAPVVQYLRPEIIGFILGSFLLSLGTHEFKARGGSSPMLRFAMGFMVMIGALVFLGCPMRMVLRMAGGDLNAWIGLIGFVLGVVTGVFFLKKGFSLKRSYVQKPVDGLAMPLIQVLMLVLFLAVPALFMFSEKGPGSMHAPVAISLCVALIAGALAQRTRICQAGAIRDLVMFKDPTLLWGSVAVFVAALVMNLAFNKFNPGMAGQPIAHTEILWNILGLYVVGFGSTLLGGCPMRQLILTGTGNSDSALTVLGMIVGAAFCHNFGLASSGKGTTPNGRIACIACIVILFIIGFMNSRNEASAK